MVIFVSWVAFAAVAILYIGIARKYKLENDRLKDNLEYYQNTDKQNKLLNLRVSELEDSNDSLINNIDSVRKLLAIKPKNIHTISYIKTEITDTIRDTVSIDKNFVKTVKPNAETSIFIARFDTSLTVIPSITNTQILYVYKESKYKYPSFWKRLIHLNFKKIKSEAYKINNSNNLIRVSDTRIINNIDYK